MKTLRKSAKRRTRPTLLNGTTPPTRVRNADRRPREYLTPKEVERLIATAKKRGKRFGLRDATMILVTYRHGLRVSELCALTWDQIDFAHGLLHVRRVKNGMASVHQIGGEEMRAIKRYLATRTDNLKWLFINERGTPLTRQAVQYIVKQAAQRAKLQAHPHTLRHSCGYYMANEGVDLRTIQDYLGHRDPKHTMHYTRIAGSRFEGVWK